MPFSLSLDILRYVIWQCKLNKRVPTLSHVSEEVNYYLLVCEGTIEESEVKRLRGKEIKQHDLLGDIVKWPTSLDDALSELISHG